MSALERPIALTARLIAFRPSTPTPMSSPDDITGSLPGRAAVPRGTPAPSCQSVSSGGPGPSRSAVGLGGRSAVLLHAEVLAVDLGAHMPPCGCRAACRARISPTRRSEPLEGDLAEVLSA